MGSRLFGSRTRLIIMTLGAGFAILIIRLFYLQVVQADMWKEKASSQQMYSTSISANRGNIYDRNMKTFAKSVTVWTGIHFAGGDGGGPAGAGGLGPFGDPRCGLRHGL